MEEIDDFLGDGGLGDGVQNMEIDNNRDLEGNRTSRVDESNAGLGQNRVSGARSGASDQRNEFQVSNQNTASNNEGPAGSQNLDENAQGNGPPSNSSASSNFNIHRNVPMFLQGNHANRVRSAGVTQPSLSQGVPQINRPVQVAQGVQGQARQDLLRQEQDTRSTGQSGNGGPVGMFAGIQRPNIARVNLPSGGQHAHPNFLTNENLMPFDDANQVAAGGPGNANGNQHDRPNQFQINSGLNYLQRGMPPGEHQANHVSRANGQEGALVPRSYNRTNRRSAPYQRTAAQTRRQNFDNLASLLYSLSKKFSYVRNNPDEDNDENDPPV